MLAHGREAILPFNVHLIPNLQADLTDEEINAAASAASSITVPMTAAA